MSNIYILGNCALDNRTTFFETADVLYRIMKNENFYLKASFDKANRTSLRGKRGIGLKEGVKIFKEVKLRYPNIKLTTDVHETWQIEHLKPVIDLIQIPAFLCRQTDLVVECAKAFDFINIKKMQHLGPNNVIKSVDKVRDVNEVAQVWLTERGTSLGYDHLIVDFTIVEELKKYYDKVIFDCTHSTQRSRKTYLVQGDPELAKRYFLISRVMGYDGVFVEVHPRRNESSSDIDCMIDLQEIKSLFSKKQKIDSLV